MKKIMVTGAGGYIGSVLVPKLLEKGYEVNAVDRFFFGTDKMPLHVGLNLIKEDVRCLKDEHFIGIDAVIDLVAISNDPSGELYEDATWQINHKSRVRAAKLAKANGVKRYILPSSCSIYGFQDGKVDENAKTNPLATYAKANEQAEKGVLPLADDNFIVTVMRQSTVFGYSPRVRFDLAINGMTHGAWRNGKLPLMRDGTQYRPMVHVQDTTDVMCLLLRAQSDLINGEIFNIGADHLNYKLGELGEAVAKVVGSAIQKEIPIEWYGDPDHRSYYVSFDKIKNRLNWEPKWDANSGSKDLLDKIISGEAVNNDQSITLKWYQELEKRYQIIKGIDLYGGVLNINKNLLDDQPTKKTSLTNKKEMLEEV